MKNPHQEELGAAIRGRGGWKLEPPSPTAASAHRRRGWRGTSDYVVGSSKEGWVAGSTGKELMATTRSHSTPGEAISDLERLVPTPRPRRPWRRRQDH